MESAQSIVQWFADNIVLLLAIGAILVLADA